MPTPTPASQERARPSAPVVIQAQGVGKTFRVPEQRVDSFKERAAQLFRPIPHREHRALHDVSFEVRRGEFFGVVGRNGSGKSTLLKILASIYRADAGRVRTAGRMAPFIELGVGFNPDLTARENGVLNGVLMGLTLREARRRFDAIVAFAELEDFVDLKLKNYSSGMLVRLAFAIMVEADAEIMLVDEVLAVGDAAFAQKCLDVFHERRRRGRTVVLVTHDMGSVQSLCQRAMVLHEGELQYVGEPEEAALRYLRLNFEDPAGGAGTGGAAVVQINARVVEARLRDGTGAPIANVEADAPLALDVLLETTRELERPIFVFHVVNADGVVVFGFTRTLAETVGAGRRVRLAGPVENRLVPGRYFVDCWIRQDRPGGGMGLHAVRLFGFVVFGTAARHGVVSLRSGIEAVVEP